MRPVLASLVVLLASAAAAQAPLFPNGAGPTRGAAPHWRFSADAGLSVQLGLVATAEAERTVRGPFAVGGRALLYTDGGLPVDDGGAIVGPAGEAFASVGTRRRALDLRAFAGVGGSAVRTYSGGPDPEFGSVEPRAFRPHAVAGVGVDVYPLAGVGLGATVRAVASTTEQTLSTVSLGLRVRLAR